MNFVVAVLLSAASLFAAVAVQTPRVIVTESAGTDNDRPARFTYLLGAGSFSIKKEVRPEGASEFFERNTYSWAR